MHRREALKTLSAVLGTTLSGSTIAALLSGCNREPAIKPFVPQTLSAEQNILLADLCEMIIPETDTPGAKAARVNEFIDLLLTSWMTKEERQHFLAGLDRIEQNSQAAHQKRFADLKEQDRIAALTALEREALANFEPGEVSTEFENPDELKPFFAHLKELTLMGYYTSEIGASQELNFSAAAGRYETVPLSEVGKTWAD